MTKKTKRITRASVEKPMAPVSGGVIASNAVNKTHLLGAAILLFGLVFIAYSNHWENTFHFDDAHTIQNNAYIRSLTNIPSFYANTQTFSSLPGHGSYRPVVSTTLAIDYWLGKHLSGDGLEPFWYHLDTFVLFIVQGVLMFFFFRKILDTLAPESVRDWVAMAGTAFYMVHPALAETINYIIARSDSLSTCFMLMAFVAYQYSASARKTYWYLIPLVIGVFAKPTALMFAPMLVVYHLLFEQRISLLSPKSIRWGQLMKAVAPVFILEAGLYLFMKRMEVSTFDPGGYSLYRYVITEPLVFLHYIGQFFLPTKLSADSDWGAFETILDPLCIAGFLFLIGFTFIGLLASKAPKWRPVSFGIAFFLLALIPTSVVPLAEVTNDHRVFYPYVGLTIAVVWTAYLLLKNQLEHVPMAARFAAFGAICCCYAFGTHVRNDVWHSEESLWKDVSIKSPRNGRGLMNYALIFMARGSYDTANYWFTEALRYNPQYGLLYCNLGVLQTAMGHFDKAEQSFKSGISFDPTNPEIYHYYGRSLSRVGRNEEAIANLYRSLQYSESNLDARHLLMDLLYNGSRFEELKQVATRPLQILPGDASALHYAALAPGGKSALQVAADLAASTNTPEAYLDLSLRYYQAKQFQKSIEAAQKAIAMKPDYAEAYNNICASYDELGMFAEGKKAGEEAVRLKPDYSLAKANLAWSIQGLSEKK